MNETSVMMKKQLAREQDMSVGGIQRYHRHLQGVDIGDTTPGKELVSRTLTPMIEALQAMIDEVEQGKAGRGRPALATSYIQQLDPTATAYLTARAVLLGAASRHKLTVTALSLATAIEECYRFDELWIAEQRLAASVAKKAAKFTTARWRRQIMRTVADDKNVRGLGFSKADKIKVGMKLVEVFVETTGLVAERQIKEGENNSPYVLELTDKTSEWLERNHDALALLKPMYLPTLVEPKDWSSPVKGAYYQPVTQPDMIRNITKETRDDVFSVEMPEVYDALNRVQRTPWQVNAAVFDVFETLYNEGTEIAGLPSQEDLPIPERPTKYEKHVRIADMPEADQVVYKRYKQERAAVEEANAKLRGERLLVAAKMSQASDLKDDGVFYFAHSLDFRGRLYPLAGEVNPQGDDLAKGLLQFAEGKPLGEYGAYWLHVQLANLYGEDKISFDDRVAWVEAHAEQIMASAADPLDSRFWMDADEPWQFLAACFEYMGWRIQGDEYVSHLPIAMDGSCSGLQHFSAMLKDREGGAATNLTPQDAPADIYTEVMLKVEAELPDDHPMKGRMTRKIVKRPCMTYAYSVTSRGMRDQILDELRRDGSLTDIDPWTMSNELAPMVERAIRATVNRAAEAMDWLKEVAGACTARHLPVNWSTPDGFPVQQRYMETKSKKHFVWYGGRRVRLTLREEGKGLDGRRQKLGIAPNYVHSLDACHLRAVVNRMYEAGVTTSFAMIHDSFGVHACDVDELHYAIRDEFIKLYSGNVLADMAEAMRPALGELPDVPADGDLDLEEVRRADFFFA